MGLRKWFKWSAATKSFNHECTRPSSNGIRIAYGHFCNDAISFRKQLNHSIWVSHQSVFSEPHPRAHQTKPMRLQAPAPFPAISNRLWSKIRCHWKYMYFRLHGSLVPNVASFVHHSYVRIWLLVMTTQQTTMHGFFRSSDNHECISIMQGIVRGRPDSVSCDGSTAVGAWISHMVASIPRRRSAFINWSVMRWSWSRRRWFLCVRIRGFHYHFWASAVSR